MTLNTRVVPALLLAGLLVFSGGCADVQYTHSSLEAIARQLDDKDVVGLRYQRHKGLLDGDVFKGTERQLGLASERPPRKSMDIEISEGGSQIGVNIYFCVNADNLMRLADLDRRLAQAGFTLAKNYMTVYSYKAPEELRQKAAAMIPAIQKDMIQRLQQAGYDVRTPDQRHVAERGKRVLINFCPITPERQWSSWCNALHSVYMFPTLGWTFSYWATPPVPRESEVLGRAIEESLKPLADLDPRYTKPLPWTRLLRSERN